MNKQETLDQPEESQNTEFVLDENKIRVGQAEKGAFTISEDGSKTQKEMNFWASYEGSVAGYTNISGYGETEEEAIANLKKKIETHLEK